LIHLPATLLKLSTSVVQQPPPVDAWREGLRQAHLDPFSIQMDVARVFGQGPGQPALRD
jgi:hypothetical protein